jgi:hypothetical protein
VAAGPNKTVFSAMKLRFLGSLSSVLLLLAVTLANADDQKCHAAARECEQQIRSMLGGPRYLGVEVVQLNTGSSNGGTVVIKTVLEKSPRISDFKQVVAEARQTGKLWIIIRRRNALRKIDVRLEPYPKEYVDKVIAGHLAQSHTATASGQP